MRRTARSRIAVEQFPDAVRTLVKEGWHVEAEGRPCSALPCASTVHYVRHRLVRAARAVDFGDGRSAPLPSCSPPLRTRGRDRLLDDGSRGLVPEEWLRRYARDLGIRQTKGDHVRYRPSQTALLDALLETQPAVHVDEAFARARAELRSSAAFTR